MPLAWSDYRCWVVSGLLLLYGVGIVDVSRIADLEFDLRYVEGNLLASFEPEGTAIMICLQLYGVGTVGCSTLGLELDFRYAEGRRPKSFCTEAIEESETFCEDFDFVSFFFGYAFCFWRV